MVWNNLSPYIRVAMDSYINTPWHLKERVIFDYELLYIKEGEIIVTIEDEEYKGMPGDIFFFRPKQRHSILFCSKPYVRQPHIHFDLFYQNDSAEVRVSFKPLEEMNEYEMKLFREDNTFEMGIRIPGHIRLHNPVMFEKMLFDIIKENEIKLPFYEEKMKGLFIQLWIYLLRECYWKSNPKACSNLDDMIRIKSYVNHNIDREISLEQLACIANISKYHLIRLFKKTFGMSPIQYHQVVRVEKAREMIQFTNLSLTEISDSLGFQSIHAFSRAFKNVDGVCPSFYRRKFV